MNVQVDAPADAPPGADIVVRVTATDADDASIYNSGTSGFRIAYPDDGDGDYFPDASENCPDHFDVVQIDSDGDGIGDACDPTPGERVTISDFSPTAGPVRTTVTLSGSGFGPMPGYNVVTIGGVAATVTSASANQLLVTVPSGAATGIIAVVTAYGNTATADPFVVESSAPVIAEFSPGVGTAGTVVTISGSRFDTIAEQNTLNLNLAGLSITSATTTTLTAAVPAGTTSGRFTVTTSNGTAISAQDFFVPPSPYTASAVAATHRLDFGVVKDVAIGTSASVGLLVFDGTAGQRVGLKIVPGPISGVSLYRPNATVLSSHSTGILTTLMEPPVLPVTGTYQFLLDPTGSGTGTTAVTLYNIPVDYSATIAADGQPASVTFDVPGQNAVFTFPGQAGQRVAVKVSPGSPLGSVTLRRPDGSAQASASSGVAAAFIEPQMLDVSGSYSLKVDPLQAGTGTVTVQVFDVPPDIEDMMTIGGPPRSLSLAVGQKALLTFAGIQGEQVSVQMTGSTIGSMSVKLRNPDGTQLAAATSILANFSVATQTLPTTGTYTIVVDPASANAGSITVTVQGQ